MEAVRQTVSALRRRETNDLQELGDVSTTQNNNTTTEMNGITNAGYENLDNAGSASAESVSELDESSTVDETSAVILPEVKVYKRRWYMMAVFSLFSMVQCAVWNTWGPVSHPAMAVLGWHEHDIAMMANYGCIMIVVWMGLFMWLLVEKGLRWSMVLATGLSAAGTIVRCFTLEGPYANPLMHIGAALNGMAGPMAQGACTLMSVTWFPPHERITATSIANAANYFGAGLSFIIGPLIVSDRSHIMDPPDIGNSSATTTASPQDLSTMKEQIRDMLITYAVLAGSIFAAVLVYFPAAPPYPPSATASQTNRPDGFVSGFLQLVRKGVYWQLALVYAIALGIYGAWTSVIDVNLRPIGVTQSDAAWLGFYSILSGAMFAFITARLNDMFPRHVKKCMITLFAVAAALFGWFSTIAEGLVPLNLVELYVAGIMGSAILCGSIPLLFEVCCELAYPVSEAIASGMQILMFNVVGVIFLSSFFIPNIGLTWMNWLLFASCVLAVPAVALYKEIYVRLELDDSTERRRAASMRSETP